MLRSKCQWAEEGEKSTKYFLRLEKRNYCNKVISQLMDEEKLEENPQTILELEKNYYKELYTEHIDTEDPLFQDKINYFTNLDEEDKISEDAKTLLR